MILVLPTETITVDSIEIVQSDEEGTQLIARTAADKIYLLQTAPAEALMESLNNINKLLNERGGNFPIRIL